MSELGLSSIPISKKLKTFSVIRFRRDSLP
jgi:hypothetical protein